MINQRQSDNPYYPSIHKTKDLHDDFRLLFDHVYDLHSRLDDAHRQIKEMKDAKANEPEPGGPSSTKIAGIWVKGTTPDDGQKLTFVKASGQIEWV